MLPFLKNKEGAISAPVEHVTFGEQDDFGLKELCEAFAEDILTAIEHKDKNMLASVIEAIIEHIKESDEEEDETKYQPKEK